MTLDPRINAFRHDLADIALAGRIIAPHYARPTVRACGALATFVRQGPNSEQKAVSELLPGEEFAVLEYAGGWAWGFCVADHIVGYVEAIELTMPSSATTWCEKCAPVRRTTGSLRRPRQPADGFRLTASEQGACLSTEYGCVSLSHLRRIEDHDDDPVVMPSG